MSFKQRRDGAPGAPLINQQNLLKTLADRLENDNAADFIVTNDLGGGRTAKVPQVSQRARAQRCGRSVKSRNLIINNRQFMMSKQSHHFNKYS